MSNDAEKVQRLDEMDGCQLKININFIFGGLP